MDTNDTDPILHLASITEARAMRYLADANIPLEWRSNLLRESGKIRSERKLTIKRMKLAHSQHAELWHRLTSPLKYELSNAKVGLRLKGFDDAPARHRAFSEYVVLLEKLLAGLQKIQLTQAAKIAADKKSDPAKTPGKVAAEKGYPNNGIHWSDWVSDSTKERIHLLFDAIPETAHAKRPKPFSYRIPPDNFRREIEVLQKRTLKEMGVLRPELEMLEKLPAHTPDQIKKMVGMQAELTGMQAALSHTVHMKNEPVPFTWRGVVVPPDEWARRIVQSEDVEAMLSQKFADEGGRKPVKKESRPRRYLKANDLPLHENGLRSVPRANLADYVTEFIADLDKPAAVAPRTPDKDAVQKLKSTIAKLLK